METDDSINMTTAIENLPSPVILIDCSYKIAYANRAARKVYHNGSITGNFCYKVFYDYDEYCNVPINECPVRSFFEAGEIIAVKHDCKNGVLNSFDAGSGLVGIVCSNPANSDLDYERIIHTGKMAALGSMLVHIVHNLNSSLYVTNNYINVLKKRLETGIEKEEISQYINRIDEANALSCSMTKTLLDYTRPHETGSMIYAREAVEEIISIFSTALVSHGIELSVTEKESGPVVNRQAMLTTLFCIIQNAIDAMPAGGRLSIEISGNAVTIKDTGRGMSADIQKKLFTPYFTTMPSGTGLGLYIAKNMMNSMNGDIKIVSLEGKGTEVKLILHGTKQ